MLLPLLTCDVANNSIQNAAVQYTYDSVLEELWKDSEKKFVSVEMEFFSHWWKEQTSHVKRKVHKVVERYLRGEMNLVYNNTLFSIFKCYYFVCSTEDN